MVQLSKGVDPREDAMRAFRFEKALPFLVVLSSLRWVTDTVVGGLTWFLG
jgi:hypothetical protein